MKVIAMNLEEFENTYRERLGDSLNELRTAVLLAEQLQTRIVVIGQDLQDLSQTVEEFIAEQKAE